MFIRYLRNGSPQRGEIFIEYGTTIRISPQRGETPPDMSHPVGADFVGDGIGYKYLAPLGLKCTTFIVKIKNCCYN
jgi:hypothetical protein